MGRMSATVVSTKEVHRKVNAIKHAATKESRAKTTSLPSHEIKVRSLPDPKKDDVDPDTFLAQLVEAMCGYKPKIRSSIDMSEDFFLPIQEEQLAAYDMKLVAAARENDLDTLKAYHRDGHAMDCCNRFGETLLHLACRRGFESMVDFLLSTKQLKVRIRDDCGRTPFHDACWNPQVQSEICTQLLERDACLLLLADKRGHTPFQYGRREHWPVWRQFLWDNRTHLQVLGNEENMKIFS